MKVQVAVRGQESHDGMAASFLNKVFFADAKNMSALPDNSVHLIVTSPPYFNIKDYSMNGYQNERQAEQANGQIGDIVDYDEYIANMLDVWIECERVLKPNGKMAINAPLMPMLKKQVNTHYNRHIYNISANIEHSILNDTGLFLLDLYVWNRTNPSKKRMFGSYPYPRNFYTQNTVEFVTIYVKEGVPENNMSPEIKKESGLTKDEWMNYTRQIWDIPVPGKNDIAFGKHSAIMPEDIVRRCVRLYTFVGDVVMDPFAGSGTTLKIAKELRRNYVGYEICKNYEAIINAKLQSPLPLQ